MAGIAGGLALRRETREQYKWPKVPDGWRACGNFTFSGDTTCQVYTSAPAHKSPYDAGFEHEWVYAERWTEERWVSDWVRT